MNLKIDPRRIIVSVFVLACAMLVAPVVIRASTPLVLEACVNRVNGNMRLVAAGTPCHRNERRVQWNEEGPAGPAGPAGPPGPQGAAGSGSGGGPPYVWVCTPAHRPNSGGSPRDDVYIFNGSSSTANVAVNILDRSGTNLAGVTIPDSNPARTYPGETGSNTVPLLAGHTRDVDWVMPTTSGPGFNGITNVAFTVRVTSDKPIVVGANFQFNGDIPSQCSLLPK
jgi:hypothetical protein